MLMKIYQISYRQQVLFQTNKKFFEEIFINYLPNFLENLRIYNLEYKYSDNNFKKFYEYIKMFQISIEGVNLTGESCKFKFDDPVFLSFLDNMLGLLKNNNLNQYQLNSLIGALKMLGLFDLSGRNDLLKILEG